MPDWAANLNSALDEKLGLEIEYVSAQETRGRVPVAGNTQPVGRWHGGATCVVAESLGSLAAWTHAQTMSKIAFGVDINATHHRGVSTGYVHAVARALHLGRSSTTHEVVLTDDEGQRIATARITCALRDA